MKARRGVTSKRGIANEGRPELASPAASGQIWQPPLSVLTKCLDMLGMRRGHASALRFSACTSSRHSTFEFAAPGALRVLCSVPDGPASGHNPASSRHGNRGSQLPAWLPYGQTVTLQ
jgi:hypothetical protein